MASTPFSTNTEKTAQDWVRQLRFSSDVNKSTVGVQTDRVTPQLLLASSTKLLGISRGETQGDAKDSLRYQKVFGPVEYFAQRIQKDGGSVARSMLWKATHKGNVDFIGSGSLQPHINAVFHQSNLSQFVDNSTPLDGIDNSMKVTRIGQGGLSSQEMAPIEMRLVQPSYYGYVDGVRCYSEDTQIYTKQGWISVKDMTEDTEFATLVNGRPEWNKPVSVTSYHYEGPMYGYQTQDIDYLVSPQHKMWVQVDGQFKKVFVQQIHGKACTMLKVDVQSLTEGDTQSFENIQLKPECYYIKDYKGKIYCPTVPGGLVITRRNNASFGIWLSNTAQKCFAADTDILTQDGWKKVSKVSMRDKLCVLINGQQTYANPQSLQSYDHNQVMFGYRSQVIEFLVTQHHRMYVADTLQSDPYFAPAKYLHKKAKYVVLSSGQRYLLDPQMYYTQHYKGKTYCPTVPGGLVFVKRGDAARGFWCGNSPGITGYLTKNVYKGTDGRLYQKMLNAKTGKLQFVDSQKAASSVVTTNEYLDTKDKYVYALGGDRGVRIVKRSDVDYILPHASDAYSKAANYVPMYSGIKAMRLLMGCHHPDTPILIVDEKGCTDIVPAKRVGHMGKVYLSGCDDKGNEVLYKVRQVVPRVPQKKSKFKKVVLKSGRVLPTSGQHKWYIWDKNKFKLVLAKDLKKGMLVPRSLFTAVPVRKTSVMGVPVTKEICILLGRVMRSLKCTDYNYKFTYVVDKESGVDQKEDILKAFQQLNVLQYNFFKSKGECFASFKDPSFIDWIDQNMGNTPQTQRIPKCLLSLPKGFTSQFLDSYCKDLINIGEDGQGDNWLVDIPNQAMRDGLAFMLSKIYTDTKFRDAMQGTAIHRALQLTQCTVSKGDIVLEPIVSITDMPAPGIMIDIDCDDNVYAAANGVITHNSKYGTQAVPLQEREAPLVRSLDEATGQDMPTLIGKMAGTQWAPKAGMVKAVRKDRIDMLYDDGTKGSVYLYENMPANAKGWLSNYVKVKAGDKVNEGQLLATSNYTDDNGVFATGRNLRIGYMSYHGGTYEDACVVSQSAAKKLAATTMYKTGMDKDKSVRTSKSLYSTWKPGQYTKQQLEKLDDSGVAKVGAVLQPGDPMILGIRTTEPSPGTLGKRILSDVTQVWDHHTPGVVTDTVNTKDGIRVYATVSKPLQVGDKISGYQGNKGQVAQVIPDDKMPRDSKGRPLQLLFDPLGIISRCYDDQTQFLTKEGWKFGKDVQDSDILLCFDPDTDTCRWDKQLQPFYSNYYTGIMYGAKNQQCDFLVTKGHKMWAKTDAENAIWKQVKIQDIYGKRYYIPAIRKSVQDISDSIPFQLPQVTPKQARSAADMTKPILYQAQDWAQLLGWYLSEGNTTYNQTTRDYKVHISQSKQKNPIQWMQIDALLSRMGLSYHYSQKNIQFHISGRRIASYFSIFGHCDQKYLDQWLFKQPLRIKQIFLSAMLKGDGRQFISKNGTPCCSIALTSFRLIEQLHRLCSQLGYRCVIRPVKTKQKYKPMLRLAISKTRQDYMIRGNSWYTVDYSGKVYCPTVKTGYVVTRRNSKLLIASNTNPSQLMQAALGKVAAKTGKPIVVPQFMPKGQSRMKYVKGLLKANNVPLTEDIYDPQSNRTVKNVFTGVSYFMPLKHQAQSKMSARGTSEYTAEGVPMGGGLEGCFPGWQLLQLAGMQHKMQSVIDRSDSISMLSWDFQKEHTVFKKVTDKFRYTARKCDILSLTVDVALGGSDSRQQVVIYPTVNHKMYLADGTCKLAGQLQTGDKLFSLRGQARISDIRPYSTDTEQIPVYDLTVQGTHNYVLQGGILVSNSKRIGSLQVASLVGHNVFGFLQQAKLIRGQSNADFWRSIRTGQIPVIPGEPLVHKKFFAHLQASGMNIKRTPQGQSIFALSNNDVNQMAGNRQLKSTDTYEQKSFRPIDGGLFGQDIFGPQGDHWGYIQLDTPLPNPVMQQPLARLLNMSDQDFQQVVKGNKTVNNIGSAAQMKQVLSKMDLQKQAQRSLRQLKEAKPSKKDAALKRYVAIARMRDNGVQPSQYMLDRVPVLPPRFRPITSHGDLTMVADSNYLYSQLLNARDDAREARDAGLPQQYQREAQANIYNKWKQLVGLYDPSDVKLKSKAVKGLLKWALGTSNKRSAFMQKVLGSTVDTVGRGVIVPSTKIKLNQIGLPKEMAWNVYAPFVTRKLVQLNYTPIEAMKMVKAKSPAAFDALKQAMAQRPVVMNRAPSLHKLSLMGFEPVLVNGNAIHVNPSIVVPYGADFDGDTIQNTVKIVVDLETLRKITEKSHEKNLTNKKSGVQYLQTKNQKGIDTMIKADDKIQLTQVHCSLADIPVVKGSEVRKSENVTEWDVDGYVLVDTIDPATGEPTTALMTKVSKHTGLKMYDCTLSVCGGFTHVVTASEDHSLITLDKNTLELTKTKPEDAKGALVPRAMSARTNRSEYCAQSIKIHNTYKLTYEMGVFLGCMIGDGWVDANSIVRIACCDPSLQAYMKEHFSPGDNRPFTKEAKLHSYPSSEGRFSKENMERFTLYMEEKDRWALKDHIGTGAYYKQIPPICLMGSKAHLIGLLCGLLATDGCVTVGHTSGRKSSIKTVAIHTTSCTLRDNIQTLALRLGIKTGVTPYKGKHSLETCYMITFSLEDVAKLKRKHPTLFVIPVDYKEANLKTICADVEQKKNGSFDIVPFPRGLFCEFSWAKVIRLAKDPVIAANSKGYMPRKTALKIAAHMEQCDWEHYEEPNNLQRKDRTGHTPEQAKALVAKWIDMVRNENIGWEVVTDVTSASVTEGWDCTVPGPYTFTLSTGTVVQDTVNVHVPVSQAGIRDVRQKMMPQRNLISMRKHKILYMPQKAYTQGLYVASRMGDDKNVRVFDTIADAKKAYRQGTIDVDTPIVIKQK